MALGCIVPVACHHSRILNQGVTGITPPIRRSEDSLPQPLCVVDGLLRDIPSGRSIRNCIAINDIAIVDRLDSAQATKLYGVAGAHGAAVFTTRKYRREHPAPPFGLNDFTKGRVFDLPHGKVRILGTGVFIMPRSASPEDLTPEERAKGVVILTPEPGNTMSVKIATDTQRSARDQLLVEGREILETQNEFADKYHIIRATVIVCRTVACADGREIPEEIFVFERQNKSWMYNAELSKNDAN